MLRYLIPDFSGCDVYAEDDFPFHRKSPGVQDRGGRKDNTMCTFNTSSGCDCPCECDILLAEDRDMCPAHGTEAQEAKAREAQARRRVSVGRTQPLWES